MPTPTVLTVTTSAAAGTVLPAASAVDASNGNSVDNSTGRVLVNVINGAASPITVTFVTQGVYTVSGVNYAIADLAVTVTNGTTRTCGPFDKTLFNDANSLLQITWSSGTTITAQAICLGAA
jgi:hypothetical protein